MARARDRRVCDPVVAGESSSWLLDGRSAIPRERDLPSGDPAFPAGSSPCAVAVSTPAAPPDPASAQRCFPRAETTLGAGRTRPASTQRGIDGPDTTLGASRVGWGGGLPADRRTRLRARAPLPPFYGRQPKPDPATGTCGVSPTGAIRTRHGSRVPRPPGRGTPPAPDTATGAASSRKGGRTGLGPGADTGPTRTGKSPFEGLLIGHRGA
jgi:hypothetical protein